uniref:Phosphofurin acidic cluster sorting protein 1/2 N-terminal C2 domain-containing protein n=1 Tax=Panagrolaimus superbus TaxID=310955 RepID=A0A914Y8J7_9BILA
MFEKMDRHPVGNATAFIGQSNLLGGYSHHHGTSSINSGPMGGGIGIAVVPMKLYANWEMDRASSSTVQRVLTLVVNRLVLPSTLKADTNFTVAARLQGHKRTLRSNDINLPQSLTTSTSIDINLDISFTIQYSHYLKRKSNLLQILIQRRKRYKNRHIPGFKTLAIGSINLDDILQFGGPKEIQIWDTAYLNKTSDLNDYGTVYISNCQSQAIEISEGGGGHKTSPKDGGLALSEEEDDDDTEESDFEVQDDDGTPRYGKPSSSKTRRTRKKLNQKNIKSKLTALLKRFKAQDAGPSTGKRQPTEEELEEIFEELENISDSGPELNEPDKMSIISGPKPGLRPFFGSKTDILPSIEDRVASDESPVETDEQEFSSDNENHPLFLSTVEFPMDSARSHTKSMTGKRSVPDNRTSRSSSMKEKNRIIHSATIESMGSAHELKNLGINQGPKKIAPDMYTFFFRWLN